ncbi:MAG: hypothetical protein LBJ59_05060, partial [Zoogloeaceae bacterium]|nr:hypothetical protein [Zoogloeaceae bacterium]
MKAFRVLFVILMMIAAAPTRACSIGQNAFVPENYTESVRAFANKTAQELGSQDTPEARLKLAEALLTKAIQEFDSTCRGTFPGEGIAFDNEIDRRFGDDKSPKMRAIVLKALINKTNRA